LDFPNGDAAAVFEVGTLGCEPYGSSRFGTKIKKHPNIGSLGAGTRLPHREGQSFYWRK
jgi:hypothetical protein